MPYGYLGQNTPNQTVSNSGVFSISDVASLEKQGKFGGSLELIAEQTVTSVSTIDFTSIQENIFDVLCLQYTNWNCSADANPMIRISNNNGSSYIASGYQYAYQYGNASGSFGEGKSTSFSYMSYVGGFCGGTNETSNGYIYFYNLGNSSKYSFHTFQSFANAQTPVGIFFFGGAVYPTAETHNAIRILPSVATTISTCTAKLYGVKQL